MNLRVSEPDCTVIRYNFQVSVLHLNLIFLTTFYYCPLHFLHKYICFLLLTFPKQACDWLETITHETQAYSHITHQGMSHTKRGKMQSQQKNKLKTNKQNKKRVGQCFIYLFIFIWPNSGTTAGTSLKLWLGYFTI